jgi:small subunit ribosomal protein S6
MPSSTRPYEVMVILEPSLEESQVQAVINRSTELLQSNGGAVNRVDKWGKRRFAYELAKRTEGYYVLLDVTAEPAPMQELDRRGLPRVAAAEPEVAGPSSDS